MTLHAAPRPCSTCPYRRDTPPGIWHPDEYAKLPLYDEPAWDGQQLSHDHELALFHCHQETATHVPTVCRGWLHVHADSVAVRLGIGMGQLTIEQRDAEPLVDLYATGAEAAAAGLAGCDNPDVDALDAQIKLLARFSGLRPKRGDEP